MKNKSKIKYTPLYTPEDLRQRILNLSDAIGKALAPLQALVESGAAEIADEEAIYVSEMAGFLDLMDLVRKEEFTEAIKSVNKACWEIEVAKEEGTENVEHPWLDQQRAGGWFETRTFYPGYEFDFDHERYGPTPMEKEEMDRAQQAQQNHLHQAKPDSADFSIFGDF